MRSCRRVSYTFIGLLLFLTAGCNNSDTRHLDRHADDLLTVTLLFTNDFESAYDPTLAFWRDDIQRIGGIAQLATLIDEIRANEPNAFLFDAGDIFTGTLSKMTLGSLAFELMISIGYDAMTVGNHEFEYGWEEFARQKNRAPFPVLGANLFYAGTNHPYAQPFAIVEKKGVRIAVIGILGQDAATALIPSNIAGVDVRDPAPVVARYVNMLRDDVDLVVLLTHQGKTAPMQTDKEGRPEIQRDIDADINLAGVVDGIDVLFAGHADAGTREPVVHPVTGTLIMQTFGQGFHLGYLQLELNTKTREIESYDGRLIAVDSDSLTPNSAVQQKLDHYRAQNKEIYEVIGTAGERLNRQYNQESDLGNLFADIIRKHTGADVGLMPSGALRKDIAEGKVTRVALLDAFPFTDRVATIELPGRLLVEILEQGLSLERGILQISGLEIQYDSSAPVGQRLVNALVLGRPLDEDASYRVGTIEILAQGGDGYRQFTRASQISIADHRFSDVLEQYFSSHENIPAPDRGRLQIVNRPTQD